MHFIQSFIQPNPPPATLFSVLRSAPRTLRSALGITHRTGRTCYDCNLHKHRLQRQQVNNNNRHSEITRKEMGSSSRKGNFSHIYFTEHKSYITESVRSESEELDPVLPPFHVNLISRVNPREAQLNPCRLASVHLSGEIH